MIPRNNRLNSVQFSDVFKSGKKRHGPDFMVIYKPHDETRIAVTISKKKAKRAFQRTQVRRKVYEYVRKNHLEEMNGLYIVMVKGKEFDLEGLKELLV